MSSLFPSLLGKPSTHQQPAAWNAAKLSLSFYHLLCELEVFSCVCGPLQLWAPARRESWLLSQCLCPAQEVHPGRVCCACENQGLTCLISPFSKPTTVILVSTTTTKTYFQQAQSPFCGYHVCVQNHPFFKAELFAIFFLVQYNKESWQTMFRHGPLGHRLIT